MNTIKQLFLVTAVLASTNGFASSLTTHLYGKADLSYDWQLDGIEDSTDNASRVGISGEYDLNEKLAIAFQLEQGIDLAHGGTAMNALFSMRNSYIGLKGDFGLVFLGSHDTPFKKSQTKVDVFNDHAGDIKNILAGEVRARDALGYHSPKWDNWALQAMYVPSDGHFDASYSTALKYTGDRWTFGFGIDEDMRKNDKSVNQAKVYDSIRASALYKIKHWRFGIIVQESERQDISQSSKQGFVLSVAYSLNKWHLIAQHGESNLLADDATSTNFGVQYRFLENVKGYLHYWNFDKGSRDETLSLGFEYKL